MPYYAVYRESVALQSCGVYADSEEEAKQKALKENHWETDDIDPCTCTAI